jgi:4-carboxymuconolactone decarboxylase
MSQPAGDGLGRPSSRAPMPSAPRVAPVPLSEADERVRSMLEPLMKGPDGEPMAIFGTIARHPKLLQAWLPFGGRLLLGGTLDRRLTELAILRTAFWTDSDYEWGQHVRICAELGIEREVVDRVPAGATAPGWTGEETLILCAADELLIAGTWSDETWAALRLAFDEEQVIELCFLVGHYDMLATVLRTLGVPLEAGLEPLPRS